MHESELSDDMLRTTIPLNSIHLDDEQTTKKLSDGDESNIYLSTLIPFPPIMPGGQFYVDQHVSYGQFGRTPTNLSTNVVYDPNVLKRFVYLKKEILKNKE